MTNSDLQYIHIHYGKDWVALCFLCVAAGLLMTKQYKFSIRDNPFYTACVAKYVNYPSPQFINYESP